MVPRRPVAGAGPFERERPHEVPRASLHRAMVVGPIVTHVLVCFAIAGLPGVVWGFALSTMLMLHATMCINSLAHVWGTRRYDTGDQSRNNAWLAVVTLGEGWHNNHHHFESS